MKILGGKYKRKNLIVPLDVRPVSVMVKKSCFDILREEIEGKKVLDLFAGSGSLGLESLSRGAKEATFIDSEKKSIAVIKKNILSLGLQEDTKVILKDSFSAVQDLFVYKESFDLIFLDPPYHGGMVTKALQALKEYDILTRSGYIMAFCYEKDDYIEENDKFFLILKRKHGKTLNLIYQKR
ncbi:MAG: 16S rRNA (guanine(966)-N(2))-methyltransferase RsmD [Candidatus Omnitrophica bacterium]|nr:16S rRNA (guanine(966)-N(2))-methyltransferase RsmD [Candidatus Omnitrophota bacterium]